jgi:hypothetical protein
MKSLKDLRTQIDEVLTKKDPAAKWIHDFVHSDNPKFAGKSMAKRRQMALAAYYSNKNEAAFVSPSMSTDIKGDLEEAFLSKKEQDDLDNLSSDDFVKKYGHAKHVHRKSHATKATDVEKFTESQDEDDRRGAEHHQKELEQQQQELEAKKKKEKVKEEVEQIDELKKSTLASYVKKAHKDNALTANDLGHRIGRSNVTGEILKPSYIKDKSKYSKRSHGIDTAVSKLAKEEVEQIDEISKKTLGSYVKHASWDMMDREARIGTAQSDPSHPANKNGDIEKAYTKQHKRNLGMTKAINRLTKETTEYKGIGTDVVDKKKVLNPPIPLTQKKKTVKDFKEQLEIEESRGHKVIAAFLKNREVAQRAFTGQNKPTEKKPEPEKKEVKEGFDDYHAIAKELVKRHGKNVDTGHINDLAGERDSHRGLDHSEVMHHVNKLLNAKKEVKEGEVYDEKWKKFKKIKEGVSMLKFNDFLKEAWQEGAGKAPMQEKLVGKQHKLDKNKNGKLDADDFKKLRNEGKKCMDEDDMDESGLRMAAHAAHKSGKKEFEFKGKTYPVKVQKEEAELEEAKQGLWANIHAKRERIKRGSGEKMRKPGSKGAPTDKALKDSQESVQIDELSKKTLGSYVNKAAKDSRLTGQIATDFENQADKARKQSKKDSFERLNRKYLGKAWKREDGIATAVKKLTKEDVQLDEGKMKDIYTSMMHHADKKGYSSHKQFTPADYDAVGKEHGISGKELAIIAGHKTARQVANEAVDKVEKDASGKVKSWSHEGDWKKTTANKEGSGKAANLAGQALKKTQQLSKEEVEQVSEDNHAMAYVNATLAVMDEGKIDDLQDKLRAKRATQSAYDKDYKQDKTHPSISLHKGTSYGGQAQKDDEGDEKPEVEKEKRGRGRPHGSKSGARQKGNGREDGGIPVHNLHLPNRNK